MSMRQLLITGLLAAAAFGCSQNLPTSQATASPTAATSPATETATPVAAANMAARSGSFVKGEAPTSGMVTITQKDGKTVLELDRNFQTSEMGPDLVVALHKAPDVLSTTEPPAYALNEGDYVVIEELQSFQGAQSYEIPANINVDEYQSVVIWCRRFNATFGTAALQ